MKHFAWLALLAGCATAPTGGLVLGVMGDVPYTEGEVQRLEALIDDINRERLDFVLHIGDIGANACDDATLEARKQQFARIRHPFVLLPGDNEWVDCHKYLKNNGLNTPTERLQALPGLRIVGTAPHKAAVVSFVMEGIHPHDIGTILDTEGVAIRTGHHCAMPVMEFFNVPATARASFACYSRESDIDALVAALARAHEVFA